MCKTSLRKIDSWYVRKKQKDKTHEDMLWIDKINRVTGRQMIDIDKIDVPTQYTCCLKQSLQLDRIYIYLKKFNKIWCMWKYSFGCMYNIQYIHGQNIERLFFIRRKYLLGWSKKKLHKDMLR